jgi:glutamyl-Q tRNA(Asp) synthetase
VAVNAAGEKLSKQTHAAPLEISRPGPALFAALKFLGQRPPPELSGAPVDELWQWATENWQLGHIPRGPAADSILSGEIIGSS